MFNKIALKGLCIILTFLAATEVSAQKDFIITGKLSGEQQGVVLLTYSQYIDGREVYSQDSARITNGQFILKGKVGYPVQASVSFQAPNRTMRDHNIYRTFYLDPANILIESSEGPGSATIKGGKTQQMYEVWEQKRKPYNDSLTEIFSHGHELGSAMNGEAIRELQRKAMPIQKRLDRIDSTFMADNTDNQAAYDLRFKRALREEMNIAETETAFNRFSEEVRNTPPALMLKAKINKAKELQPGQPAPDFTLNDLSGQPVSLSSYKGRYVLLVFSTYTGNYGTDNFIFNLKRVYSGINTANFVMLTITGDPDAASVKKVTEPDGLKWTHVLRNEKEDATGKKYDIDDNGRKAFLIGPDGKFLLTDIHTNSDIATQIKYAIPGAEKSLAKVTATVIPKAPLNVYLGDEITEYPQVEWLKGGPIAKFDKDKIYIVELWATWCVPCIAAMPHLSDLQRKFKDKNVIIIAQGVWEEDKAKAANFVKTKGTDLDYLVAFSGQKGSEFDKRWCVPAQVSGIPATFVIQNGRLVWQTYPTNLNDEILQLLIDKKFTIAKAEALITKR